MKCNEGEGKKSFFLYFTNHVSHTAKVNSYYFCNFCSFSDGIREGKENVASGSEWHEL